MKKIILIFVALLSLSFGTLVSAQGLKDAGGVLQNIGGQNGEKLGVSADLSTSIATVIKAVLSLLGTIFLALTIYAGILWMTAAGNDEQVTKATGILKMAVTGLIIIMSAYAITYFVTSKLTGAINSPSQNQNGNENIDLDVENPWGCCYEPSGAYGSLSEARKLDCVDAEQEFMIMNCDDVMGCCDTENQPNQQTVRDQCLGANQSWALGACQR